MEIVGCRCAVAARPWRSPSVNVAAQLEYVKCSLGVSPTFLSPNIPILDFSEEDKVLYARMTPDISSRRVLLLYPIVRFVLVQFFKKLEGFSTGNTVVKAVNALREAWVLEENIYIITLFITPEGQSPFSHCTLFLQEVVTIP